MKIKELKSWMKQHGRSAAWVAAMANVHEKTVLRLLDGANVRPAMFFAIAAVMANATEKKEQK